MRSVLLVLTAEAVLLALVLSGWSHAARARNRNQTDHARARARFGARPLPQIRAAAPPERKL